MPAPPRRFRDHGAWVPVEPGMQAVGVAQQLETAGYETHRTRAGRRVWFAPTQEALSPLLQASAWITHGASAQTMAREMAAAGDPPNPEPTIDLHDLAATAALRRHLQERSPIEVMQRWRDECVSRRRVDLERLLDTILLPELFRRWPDSVVCFVGPTERTHAITTAVRAHSLREIATWQGVRAAAAGGGGFPVLRALHTGIGASASLYLGVFSALALPHHRIWVVPRLPGELVVVLGEEVRVPAHAVGEREFVRDPLEVCYMAPRQPRRFHQPIRVANVGDGQGFIEEGVRKLNAMLDVVFAIHGRTTDHRRADCISTMKVAFVVERIAQSVLSIATGEAEYNRVNDSFAALDLIASLATQRLHARIDALPRRPGASNNAFNQARRRLIQQREPLLGDALLSEGTANGLMGPSLDGWQCRASHGLSHRARQLLEGLHHEVARSVFLGERDHRGRVRIRFREVDEATGRRGRWRTRRIERNRLAPQILRQLRNTHHGYHLYDELFEGLLAVTDGGIGDHLPSYIEHTWLAVLGDPNRWLGGGLADFVGLPRQLG